MIKLLNKFAYPYLSSKHKVKNWILLLLTIIVSISGLYLMKSKDSNAYALGEETSQVVPGTTLGNCTLWPRTDPVYIINLYDSEGVMDRNQGGYTKFIDEKFNQVIPYASSDSIWLGCSDLSISIDDKTYISTKNSIDAGSMSVTNDCSQVVLLKNNKTTTLTAALKKGVFYEKIYSLYASSSVNRDFRSLANNTEFKALLSNPSDYRTKSLQLWAYITDADRKGTSSTGYSYTVNVKERIDEFLHEKELAAAGFSYNRWRDTEGKEITVGSNKLTTGEELNLRYLDLLMTLNALSGQNKRTYWTDGVNNFLTDNTGKSNISITMGIVSEGDIELKSKVVNGATVLASCNDICQVAYHVNADNNLSKLESATKISNAVGTYSSYTPLIKKAVNLSNPSSYENTSIYSTAIISRILSEDVRKVVNNKLVWGDSHNSFNIIDLIKYKSAKWYYGTNWVPEPPHSESTVLNYTPVLDIASKQLDKINAKVGSTSKSSFGVDLCVELKKLYEGNDNYTKFEKIKTMDEVKLRVYLKTLDGSGKQDFEARKKWDEFLKTNSNKEFKIKFDIYRSKQKGMYEPEKDYPPSKKVNEFTMSTGFVDCNANTLKGYIIDKQPIYWNDIQIKDESIMSSLDLATEKDKNIWYQYKYYVVASIKYKRDNKWYYISGKNDDTGTQITRSNKKNAICEEKQSNDAKIKYKWLHNIEELNYPSATYISSPALAYSELKEGSIYNETFEAMAGVPSTRTLYFATGGEEFLVDMKAQYDHDQTGVRSYISHFKGTECEYKKNDQLKQQEVGSPISETFVGDAQGNTISSSMQVQENNAVNPDGASSYDTTVKEHNSETRFTATWEGSISNSTGEPADIGKFNPGKPGSPCAGKDFDKGTQRQKAEPSTNWSVSDFNSKLSQAIKWAKDMEATGKGGKYTVMRIADSDGHKRMYLIGDAVITINLTGGSNSFAHTTQRSYSGGTYTSSSAESAKLQSGDKKLGSGWGWTDGKFGVGSGYSDCGHGHGASGWHTAPVPATKTSSGSPGVPHSHNCGSFTPGTDLTQGASETIDFTITVTFKNGKITAKNKDGDGNDVNAGETTGFSAIPPHALCGACCCHDLPAIEDVWYQELPFDTIKLTRCNVYKIHAGYLEEMQNITKESKPEVVATIIQGDPNIFYNIAADNNPKMKDKKLLNGSAIGRIRYSLQEAQGDNVYYEELMNNEEKRTNKCDGLCVVKSSSNPVTLKRHGHELSFATGCLYNNGPTEKFGTAKKLDTKTEDLIFKEKTTKTSDVAKKVDYSNKTDDKDIKSKEWERFFTRRTQMVTATVISDMLLLQTSSGDQSPLYYAENTKSVQAQEDYNALTSSGDVKVRTTQEQIDAKWKVMWTDNPTTFAKVALDGINIGSYNGLYDQTSSKYKGSGGNEKIPTRFDKDKEIFSKPEDELKLAKVKSNQSFTKPAYGSTNISSPGKSQARMDRAKNLRICIDKIKQKPTNKNAEYLTGDSYLFYKPILKYIDLNEVEEKKIEQEGDSSGSDEDNQDNKDAFDEEVNEVLVRNGFNYGPGLTFNSVYSAYDDGSPQKCNDIVVHDVVTTQNAMIEQPEVEDQRTSEGVVKEATEKLQNGQKCPGVPSLCEYRQLNCKYLIDTTSIALDFEDTIIDKTKLDTSLKGTIFEESDEQTVKNSLLNEDQAHTEFKLGNGMSLTSSANGVGSFGTGNFLKVSGKGTSLTFPYYACNVQTEQSSRIKISADLYIPNVQGSNTMIFSIGGVGLYIPANSAYPVFISRTGMTRACYENIIGKRVKIAATFSLGSLYDCELQVNGVNVIPQISQSSLSQQQIIYASIDQSMWGDGLKVGCWEYNNDYSSNFYMDNLTVVRRGGVLTHTASCTKINKKQDCYYQYLYNGVTNNSDTIDWLANYDDGSYSSVGKYSKHTHTNACFTGKSKGYEIAVKHAEDGDWTDLKKELGPTLWSMVKSKYEIDEENGSSSGSKEISAGKVLSYEYQGKEVAVELPSGTYVLETWGAQGSKGGYGGYSKAIFTTKKKVTLYVNVGGAGGMLTPGYNGGGYGYDGGGGATSINLASGLLSSLVSNRDKVLLVAGGGGGAGSPSNPGGSGGGANQCGAEGADGFGSPGTGGTLNSGGVGGDNYGQGGYFGQGGSNTTIENNGAGGGGGGYFGGGAGGNDYPNYHDYDDSGAGGGSGYANTSLLTEILGKSGDRSGAGLAKITVVKANCFPEKNQLDAFILQNKHLIPDQIITNQKAIINPIWDCGCKFDTGETYTTEIVLNCTEPHHSGQHYDYSNEVCWDACCNDANHKTTKTETVSVKGVNVKQATYVVLDNFFKVYYDNLGDYYGTNEYGILKTTKNRGKGFINNMDTTEWLREKYIKFDYDVLYNRSGVWEYCPAGRWISLEIVDPSTTKTYSLSGNSLTIDGNTYKFDISKGLMQCNGQSTTLIEDSKVARMNGKIFEVSGSKIKVSDPYIEYDFYCLLANNEISCSECDYAVEAINYGKQSSDSDPYKDSGRYEQEFDINAAKNKNVTNKNRKTNLTALHTAAKITYHDVIGRIGNLIVEDTDDIRFSSYFKKSYVEENKDWYIQGIIPKVDSSISTHYLSWHRNSPGYPFATDVRGEQVSEATGYYNTWGTQEWTQDAKSNAMGLAGCKNDNPILQSEQLKLGYNVLFDISTIGNYNQYIQVLPYFYALNKQTNELTPIDVYDEEDGVNKPINYWGLYSEHMDSSGNKSSEFNTLANNLYKYNMYLNWTDEKERRNFKPGGQEAKVTNDIISLFVENVYNADGEEATQKFLTMPSGNYYNLGTMQCMQPGARARTFIGTSRVTAIISQAARLGITNNGINGGIETNIGNNVRSQQFSHQAQRWHMTMGLPSSSVFTAYREKGIHIKPDEDCYILTPVSSSSDMTTKKVSETNLKKLTNKSDFHIDDLVKYNSRDYKITKRFKAGNEFINNNDYVIVMTADIKSIGDVWKLKYNTGKDNGYVIVDGKVFEFDDSIPTFIAAYDPIPQQIDIDVQQTH